MKKLSKFWLLMPFLMLSGCSMIFGKEPVYNVLAYQEDMIVLQDLETRVLVYCYNSDHVSTEQCASEFEKRGFVRLTDIPRLTAEYDTLKANTYPTRRWRSDEKVPRW